MGGYLPLPGQRRVRPVPNVVLLPCRTQMSLSFPFKRGSSTRFETIKRGTAELGSARLLSRASLPCRTAVARLAFKRRAIVVPNSINKSIKCILHYFHIYKQ